MQRGLDVTRAHRPRGTRFGASGRVAGTAGSRTRLAAVGAPARAGSLAVACAATAELIGRVAIEMPVTVTCGPFDIYSLFAAVQVSQPAGQDIAQAIGGFVGQAGFPVTGGVVCDRSPQTVPLSMSSTAAGTPFRNGPAVAAASATVSSVLGTESVTDGPKTIKLR